MKPIRGLMVGFWIATGWTLAQAQESQATKPNAAKSELPKNAPIRLFQATPSQAKRPGNSAGETKGNVGSKSGQKVDTANSKPGKPSGSYYKTYRQYTPRGQLTIARLRNGEDPGGVRFFDDYGFDIVEADPVLRSQLKLPDDQGAVVVRVGENGLADQSGLKVNDLILKLDKENVAKPDQIRVIMAKVGSGAIPVTLIRAGEPRQLSLIGPDHGKAKESTTYWIGVNVAPVDATLRSHLSALPADAGLIATEIVADSPAAKVGIQKNDILIKIDGQPLTNQEFLVDLIQKSEGKPVKINLLRAGQSLDLTVNPAPHPVSNPGTQINLQPLIFNFTNTEGLTYSGAPYVQAKSWAEYSQLMDQYREQIAKLGIANNLGDYKIESFVTEPKLDAMLESRLNDLSTQIRELNGLISEMKKKSPTPVEETKKP